LNGITAVLFKIALGLNKIAPRLSRSLRVFKGECYKLTFLMAYGRQSASNMQVVQRRAVARSPLIVLIAPAARHV
jgi:hypothetical protein